MKKSILFYLAMFLMVAMIFVRCKDEKHHYVPVGDNKILGRVSFPNGEKQIAVLLRKRIDTIQYNQSGNKIMRAELWGYPINDTDRDKSGKPIIDTTTKLPKMKITYTAIPASWVFIDLTGRDYDSLMKKDSIIKK